jgi:aspartyl protease family protein
VNDGDQAANFIYFLLLLVLVVSALAARRIPMRQGFKMAAAWALIFGVATAGFALRDDFSSLGRHVMTEIRGAPVQSGKMLRIRQAEDGHFWVDADVNGTSEHFLIDSGATVTSLSGSAARKAGVDYGGGFKAAVDTANGMILVDRGSIAKLKVGPIERDDLDVQVSDGFGDTNVLGMNFLSSLSGWEVEGPWLILKP